MKPTEARSKLLSLIKKIPDEKMRAHALRALLNYLKTPSIVEKKVYRARVITFYSEAIKHLSRNEKRRKLNELMKLLRIVRK